MTTLMELTKAMSPFRSNICTKLLHKRSACRDTQHFNLSVLIQHIIGLIFVVIIVMAVDVYGKFTQISQHGNTFIANLVGNVSQNFNQNIRRPQKTDI